MGSNGNLPVTLVSDTFQTPQIFSEAMLHWTNLLRPIKTQFIDQMTCVMRKQTLRSLSLSYRTHPCFGTTLHRSYSLKVGVIPKEGRARPRAPILLLVWQRQRPYGLFSRATCLILKTINDLGESMKKSKARSQRKENQKASLQKKESNHWDKMNSFWTFPLLPRPLMV